MTFDFQPLGAYLSALPSNAAPGGGPDAVTSVHYDLRQELLWVGHSSGSVRSLAMPAAEPYTAHQAAYEPISALVTDRRFNNGVLALASDTVKLVGRRGAPLWSVSAKQQLRTATLLAMAPASLRPTHELVVSCNFARMAVIHVERGAVLRDITADKADILFLHPCASNAVAMATQAGAVSLLDNRSWRITATFNLPSAPLTNLTAVGDNYLVASGFQRGQATVDVIDVRASAKLGTIAVAARLLQHLETDRHAIAVADHTATTLDIPNLRMESSFTTFDEQFATADVPAPVYSCLDVSSTGDLLALGDTLGHVHLFHRMRDPATLEFPDLPPTVNPVSDPITVPSLVTTMDSVPWDESIPFTEFGMPYYDAPLLSGQWPGKLAHTVGLPPPTIDPRIMANARGSTSAVLFAPKPASVLRNQWPYRAPAETPRFKSAKSARSRSRGRSATPASPRPVVDDYKQMTIQYSRFGVHDFDFSFYNATEYGGLETDVPQSYANNVLQALFFAPAFRAAAIAHALAPTCTRDLCLLCETGFLFRMLEQAHGAHCRAANWCSTFAHLPETLALNLRENRAVPFPSYATTIQHCTRFLLDQFHREAPGAADAFRILWEAESECMGCREPKGKRVETWSVELGYPGLRQNHESTTFTDLVHAALVSQETARVWCDTCRQYKSVTQRRRIVTLPSVLHIHCNAKRDWNTDWWCTKDSHFTGAAGSPFLAPRIKITVTDSGEPSVSEPEEGEVEGVYELMAVICEVTDGTPHIISHVQTKPGEWVLFNDFRVRQVPDNHVFQFPNWKIPCVLQYHFVKRTDAVVPTPTSILPDLTTTTPDLESNLVHILESPQVVNPGLCTPLSDPLTAADLSGPDLHLYPFAIDAEFVSLSEEEAEYTSDGLKTVTRPAHLALARVSLIRGGGPRAGTVAVDDYIEPRDAIVDYLTAYSGIHAADLDRHVSRHALVPLKAAYRKLRAMVDLGVVFIGHGLAQDFRIINLIVPPHQIIDTVTLYQLPHKHRKLSLKFLAWAVLGIDVQRGDHDSIEDARTALALYNRYREYEDNLAAWEDYLYDVYALGHAHGFKPPPPAGSEGVTVAGAVSPDVMWPPLPGGSSVGGARS
ncbi:poly(A)-specific ribonuclease [Allomyces arbusculus]|nr:poly(A)-specific ribonuclease [Allomyces arbusculus]